MKKLKIIIILLFCNWLIKLQAQEISSILTEKTTEILKEGEAKSFNWLTYKPSTIYSARLDKKCDQRVQHKNIFGQTCTYIQLGPDGNGGCLEMLVQNSCSGGMGGDGPGGSSPNPSPDPTPPPSGPPAGTPPSGPPNGNPNPSVCQSCANWGWGTAWLYNPFAVNISSGNLNVGNNTEPTGGGGIKGNGGGSPTKPGFPIKEDNIVKSLVRTDTLNPIIVNCDSTVSEKSQYLQNMMSVIDTTPEMKKIRDSSEFLNYEIGFTIRTLGSSPPYKYMPHFVDNNGTSQNVPVTANWYSVASVHLHPKIIGTSNGNVSPSPQDCAALLNLYSEPRKSKFMSIHAVFPDSLKTEIAIMIDDTLSANQYVSQNVISNLIDTSKVKNGVSNPQLNNWVGDFNNPKTLAGQFKIAVNNFTKEGYPSELTNLYANIYMLHMQNIPIKMYNREIDGSYKQLNFTTQTDSKGIIHFLISKCN